MQDAFTIYEELYSKHSDLQNVIDELKLKESEHQKIYDEYNRKRIEIDNIITEKYRELCEIRTEIVEKDHHLKNLEAGLKKLDIYELVVSAGTWRYSNDNDKLQLLKNHFQNLCKGQIDIKTYEKIYPSHQHE